MTSPKALAWNFRATFGSRTSRSACSKAEAERHGNHFAQGVLDIVEDGYGFLRQERYLPGPNDVYVSQSQIRRFALRTGDHVTGQVRPPKESEKYFGLLRVESVNGQNPDVAKPATPLRRPHADFPDRADARSKPSRAT